MTKHLKITVIILSVIIAGIVGFVMGLSIHLSGSMDYKSQSVLISDLNVSPDQFISDFTEINHIVTKNYSHLENKNIHPDSLFLNYSERIRSISSKEEYGNLLLEYFAGLQNGHTHPFFKKYSLNCQAKWIEGRVFIDKVGDPSLHESIKEKDEILAIDHIPVSEWLNRQQKWISASTDADRLNRSVWSIFSNYAGGERTFLLKTSGGEKEIVLPFVKSWNKVQSAVLQDTIGYIAVTSMMDDVVNNFKTEYEKVREKPVLIIDLRENGGGNSNNSEQIAEYLIREPQKACVSGQTLHPSADHYKGKLLVLIGTETFSAAESFALDLKESGHAIFIGSPTGGDTGNLPKVFTTQRGISFTLPVRKPAQLSPKGFPMEGKGIEPDYPVYPTVEDYLKNADTVLEYALKIADH